MTRLGYQIANFTYPDVPAERLFPPTVVAQAQEAESSGFDTVFVMDHFYQLPMLGQPDDPMIECYTLLSALAQHTSTVRLSSLVTGNTYRNPALSRRPSPPSTWSPAVAPSSGSGGRDGMSSNMIRSVSSSAPSPTGSRSSRRPCRSSAACSPVNAPASTASVTASPMR